MRWLRDGLAALRAADSRKILRHTRLAAKSIYHRLAVRHTGTKKLLFIVGCQRSGTTLLNHIFERDIRTSVYDEQGSAVSRDTAARLRLRDLDDVADIIARDHAPVIVLKPLVESQNIIELLDRFDDAAAVWMYRHYADVAASYFRKWDADRSIIDLRSIVEGRHDWRTEKMSPRVRAAVIEHFDEAMTPHDASALYWFARNSLVLDLDLARDDRIVLCRYADLVHRPGDEVARFYRLMRLAPPPQAITKDVHHRSVRKGSDITLSAAINSMCAELLAELDALRRGDRRALG